MNYRSVKKENIRKTNIVMAIYVFLFFTLGLLGETIWVASTLPFDMDLLSAMSYVFNGILSGDIFPLFTIIMTAISLTLIFATIKFGNKIMFGMR